MTWLSIDGGNEAATDRACYVAEWLLGVLVLAHQWNVADASFRRVVQYECVVVERTQADGRLARRKTTPATMVGLAWNTAAVAYTLAKGAPVHVYTVSKGGEASATDWIGGINKAALHQRIWAALSAEERAVVARFGRRILGARKRGPKGSGTVEDVAFALQANLRRQATGQDLLHHDWYNILDAVGVGLFHLGRVGKGAAPVRMPSVALP